MKNKRKESDEYEPQDMLDFLSKYEEKECTTEVLYTYGKQEILKENGKYYLASTIYPNYNKEITRSTAVEIWQSCNMKKRTDFSMN